MDLAQTLIRSVLRAFYETRHVLVVDALMAHSVIRDDDLAYLMQLHIKDMQKLCAKLKGDRFVAMLDLTNQCNEMHTRLETKEGMQRPIHRTYYYIDYRQAIDSIKWRVYTIDKDVKGSAAPLTEKKEYFCAFCNAEWTQMEVLDKIGPDGCLCHRCNSPLTHDLDRNTTGHEQSTRLNNQLRFITDLLPRIDNVHIPENTFEIAYENRRVVARDVTHPSLETIAVDDVSLSRPTAVKGLANVGPIKLSVNISTSDGLSEAERVAELARKEKMARQNALPSWMLSSAVTDDSFGAHAIITATVVAGGAGPGRKDGSGAGKLGRVDDKHDATLDDYFAKLKQQAAAASTTKGHGVGSEDEGDEGEEQKEVDEKEEDEEEEADFEDVAVHSQYVATPAPAVEKPAKRVQLAPEPSAAAKDESEDDVEFEDV